MTVINCKDLAEYIFVWDFSCSGMGRPGFSLSGSIRVLAVSVGVVLLAAGMKFCYPVAVEGIPVLWSSVLSWMKPPYLYLVINCIIFTIVASSRFQGSRPEPLVPSELFVPSETFVPGTTSLPADLALLSADQVPDDLALLSADRLPAMVTGLEESTAAIVPVYALDDERGVELAPVTAIVPVSAALEDERYVELTPVTASESKDTVTPAVESENSADSKLLEYYTTSQEGISARDKPLVSSRFNHRKPLRATPEGVKALRVARPKRQETVESTWKTITEGRHMPLTRHQKKPESETLKSRSSIDPPIQRIRKEPSLGQDELNRRVEAFINKFNEEMRLQRQESLKHYMEMMNRSS